MRRVIPLLIALGACAPSPPALEGQASVIDGDTLEIHRERIRLWGIDAPEGRQRCLDAEGVAYACGREVADRLDRELGGRPVACWPQERDRYGRHVGQCEVDGRDLGAWLVREGLAVRYERYAGMAYALEEAQARHDKRGVWAGSFERPWAWREADRANR